MGVKGLCTHSDKYQPCVLLWSDGADDLSSELAQEKVVVASLDRIVNVTHV